MKQVHGYLSSDNGYTRALGDMVLDANQNTFDSLNKYYKWQELVKKRRKDILSNIPGILNNEIDNLEKLYYKNWIDGDHTYKKRFEKIKTINYAKKKYDIKIYPEDDSWSREDEERFIKSYMQSHKVIVAEHTGNNSDFVELGIFNCNIKEEKELDLRKQIIVITDNFDNNIKEYYTNTLGSYRRYRIIKQ